MLQIKVLIKKMFFLQQILRKQRILIYVFCFFFPKGTCLDLVNNYSCICKAGFTGRDCDIPITRCNNDSCYPGVQCTKNNLTISCASCPSGYTGDGKNCKGDTHFSVYDPVKNSLEDK